MAVAGRRYSSGNEPAVAVSVQPPASTAYADGVESSLHPADTSLFNGNNAACVHALVCLDRCWCCI